MNIKPIEQNELVDKITSKKIKTLLVLDEDFAYCPELVAITPKLDKFIIFLIHSK